MRMHSKAQSSMELIVLVFVITLLFSFVLLLRMQKEDDLNVLGEIHKKGVVCQSVANLVSEVYSSGFYSTANLTLPYDYNVSIYSPGGLIIVGEEPETVICVMPAGLMNQSLNFSWNNIRASNSNGMVVIESE